MIMWKRVTRKDPKTEAPTTVAFGFYQGYQPPYYPRYGEYSYSDGSLSIPVRQNNLTVEIKDGKPQRWAMFPN